MMDSATDDTNLIGAVLSSAWGEVENLQGLSEGHKAEMSSAITRAIANGERDQATLREQAFGALRAFFIGRSGLGFQSRLVEPQGGDDAFPRPVHGNGTAQL
jgi:hypothetical protein